MIVFAAPAPRMMIALSVTEIGPEYVPAPSVTMQSSDADAELIAPWILPPDVSEVVWHSSGLELPSMSTLMPVAMSQESGMPFALQSLAKVDAISHESGMPLRLQSLAMPLAMSHESGTRLLLQSGTAPCATAQTSNRRSPSQSPEVGLIPT